MGGTAVERARTVLAAHQMDPDAYNYDEVDGLVVVWGKAPVRGSVIYVVGPDGGILAKGPKYSEAELLAAYKAGERLDVSGKPA